MKDMVAHTLHWLNIMDKGQEVFKQKIEQDLQNPNTLPVLFAIVPTMFMHIKVAHAGFHTILHGTETQ